MDETAVLDARPHAEAEHEAAVAQRLRDMERLEAQIVDKQQQIERLQSETLTMLAELRVRVTESPKAERSRTSGVPQSDTEETNPLARVAGSYADDPFWDEFVQLMDESRQAMDAIPASAE